MILLKFTLEKRLEQGGIDELEFLNVVHTFIYEKGGCLFGYFEGFVSFLRGCYFGHFLGKRADVDSYFALDTISSARQSRDLNLDSVRLILCYWRTKKSMLQAVLTKRQILYE